MLKPGRSMGPHYRLLHKLGEGGMGQVWLAREEKIRGLKRLVALKIAAFPGDELSRDFLKEARIALELNHPNIVRGYDVGTDIGTDATYCYLAMELVVGVTVHALSSRLGLCERNLAVQIAATIVRDAARGLHHAHRYRQMDGKILGIVHCDIKPNNLLIDANGVTKVCDFGIAKISLDSRTRQKNGRWTMGYASPEQVDGRDLDQRSDVFNLGIVFYELLTGRNPFIRNTDVATMFAIARAAVPQPTVVAPATPPELEGLVMGMLERSTKSRISSAEEVAHALDKFLASQNQPLADEITRLFDDFVKWKINLCQAAEAGLPLPEGPPPLVSGEWNTQIAPPSSSPDYRTRRWKPAVFGGLISFSLGVATFLMMKGIVESGEIHPELADAGAPDASVHHDASTSDSGSKGAPDSGLADADIGVPFDGGVLDKAPSPPKVTAPPTKPGLGRIKVTVTHGDELVDYEVRIDGQKKGEGSADVEVSAGPHTVKVLRPNGTYKTVKVRVQPNKTLNLPIRMDLTDE